MSEAGKALARDLGAVLAALLLALVPHPAARMGAGFALALFLPGYALLQCLREPTRIGSLLDLLHCGAASLCLTPLALRLAGTALPFTRATVLGVLTVLPATLLLLGFLWGRRPESSRRPSAPRSFYLLLAVTLALLAPTLAIGTTPDGGETRFKGWDLNNHLAIAEGIASRGMPPTNPFLRSESPLYYHTFFHILLGGVLAVTGPGARPYLEIALLTAMLAAIFLATFYRVVAELTGNPRVASLSLPFVSLIGGFDVAAVAALAARRGELGSPVKAFLHYWNVDGWVSNRGMMVPGFFEGFYWVPHAVAALVVFLLSLLFMRKTESGWGAIGVAGACLASMAGYNGYVALGGAATLALLRGVDFVRFLIARTPFVRDVLGRSALAGITAVVLGWPVLSLYVGEQGDVEKFRWLRPSPYFPLQILLEFGPALLFGLAGLELARRDPGRQQGRMPFLLMGAVGAPVLMTIASTGENNDLAMRISMLVWIALAVFAGTALDRLFPAAGSPAGRKRGIVAFGAVALGAGALSVLWFAVGASVAKPVLPAGEVAAGRWINQHLPPAAVIQGSPRRISPALVYLSGHPAVLSDSWASRLFYADPRDYERNLAALDDAFQSPDPATACADLRSLDVAALVVGPPEVRDYPRLGGPMDWPCLEPAFGREGYRVFRIRP